MKDMKALLDALLEGQNLTREEASEGVEAIIAGADPCQAAAFLVLLKAKGETGQEVAGMVGAMRNHMIPVSPGVPCVDIVGTGGDGHHTVNFSTAASVVAAACGASVAKHGNRSVSSMCAACALPHPLRLALHQQRLLALRMHTQCPPRPLRTRRARRTLWTSAGAARPTCWRRSASTLRCPPPGSSAALRRRASPSCSRPTSTPR